MMCAIFFCSRPGVLLRAVLLQTICWSVGEHIILSNIPLKFHALSLVIQKSRKRTINPIMNIYEPKQYSVLLWLKQRFLFRQGKQIMKVIRVTSDPLTG